MIVSVAFINIALAEHAYVGVKKCSMCHKKAEKGNQYGQWQGTAHAKAYETLGTKEAKAVAKKAGVKGDPQKAKECLKCHVTEAEVDDKLLMGTYEKNKGVQCETCHGPGNDYFKMPVMKDQKKALANGMIIPTEETCVKCHNEKSPTYKAFDYKKFYEKINHPNPKK
jgi:hypothetical protein